MKTNAFAIVLLCKVNWMAEMCADCLVGDFGVPRLGIAVLDNARRVRELLILLRARTDSNRRPSGSKPDALSN
jgi:hypothetical protein